MVCELDLGAGQQKMPDFLIPAPANQKTRNACILKPRLDLWLRALFALRCGLPENEQKPPKKALIHRLKNLNLSCQLRNLFGLLQHLVAVHHAQLTIPDGAN